MTLNEIYRSGKRALAEAGKETPGFDALCLFRKVFGLDRQGLLLRGGEPGDETRAREYLALVRERAGGRPLQYILGEWPFMGLPLSVGEGVLIPRPETELLVRTAARLLSAAVSPAVLDLCSGTGAVALGLASLLPRARVFAAELYGDAWRYLNRNIARTGLRTVRAVRLDVLEPDAARAFSGLDGLVSNPPYVAAAELPGLQEEVRREPCAALDGGADGLDFYRAITRIWLPVLKPGGTAAVEVGEGQARPVAGLFARAGLERTAIFRDLNGTERVVTGIRKAD